MRRIGRDAFAGFAPATQPIAACASGYRDRALYIYKKNNNVNLYYFYIYKQPLIVAPQANLPRDAYAAFSAG
ncbi:hypothetical protein EMIT0324P_110126 [Pseudomonas chlororaphis]